LYDYKGKKAVYMGRVKETTFKCDLSTPPTPKKKEKEKERKKKENKNGY